MAVPSSVKFKRNGVEYLDNVDRVNYTIEELTRAALKDTGKLICKSTRKKVRKLTGRMAKNIQYWVRRKSADLQVGYKPDGFYGGFQELGTQSVPKTAAMFTSIQENIDTIRAIQAQYLSALSNANEAIGLIDENEEEGQGE